MDTLTVVGIFSTLMRFAFRFGLLCLFGIVLSAVFKSVRNAWKFRNFPQEPGNFIFGDIFKVVPTFPFIPKWKSLSDDIRGAAKRMILDKSQRDDFFVGWLAWSPIVFCNSHRSLEAIHLKPNITKPFIYNFIGLKDGLVSSKGQKWKQRRKMIEPFFVTKRQRDYVKSMDTVFESLMRKLRTLIDQPLDLCEHIHTSSIDIICDATLSIPPERMREAKSIIAEVLPGIERCFIERVCQPHLYIDWLFSKSKLGHRYSNLIESWDKFFRDALTWRLDANMNTNTSSKDPNRIPNRKDLVEILMDSNRNGHPNKIDLEGVNEELITLIAAGHETIATALRWTLWILGNHLEIQTCLWEEVNKAFPDATSVDDMDKVNQLSYLDQCVKESLRLFPPIGLIIKDLDEDVDYGSKRIPKGSHVMSFILAAHRDPSVYPDPEKYDPNRFSPENSPKIPKYAFMPFGMGPRNCIGYRFAILQMKVFLIHILRNYQFTSMKAMDEVTYEFQLTLQPSCPLELKLTPRNLTQPGTVIPEASF